MAPMELAEFISGRGMALSQSDIEQLREMLVGLPIDDAVDVSGGVWEIVAQIIQSPDYEGDINSEVLEYG